MIEAEAKEELGDRFYALLFTADGELGGNAVYAFCTAGGLCAWRVGGAADWKRRDIGRTLGSVGKLGNRDGNRTVSYPDPPGDSGDL